MKCVTSLPVMLFQLLSTSGDVYISHLLLCQFCFILSTSDNIAHAFLMVKCVV